MWMKFRRQLIAVSLRTHVARTLRQLLNWLNVCFRQGPSLLIGMNLSLPFNKMVVDVRRCHPVLLNS